MKTKALGRVVILAAQMGLARYAVGGEIARRPGAEANDLSSDELKTVVMGVRARETAIVELHGEGCIVVHRSAAKVRRLAARQRPAGSGTPPRPSVSAKTGADWAACLVRFDVWDTDGRADCWLVKRMPMIPLPFAATNRSPAPLHGPEYSRVLWHGSTRVNYYGALGRAIVVASSSPRKSCIYAPIVCEFMFGVSGRYSVGDQLQAKFDNPRIGGVPPASSILFTGKRQTVEDRRVLKLSAVIVRPESKVFETYVVDPALGYAPVHWEVRMARRVKDAPGQWEWWCAFARTEHAHRECGRGIWLPTSVTTEYFDYAEGKEPWLETIESTFHGLRVNEPLSLRELWYRLPLGILLSDPEGHLAEYSRGREWVAEALKLAKKRPEPPRLNADLLRLGEQPVP